MRVADVAKRLKQSQSPRPTQTPLNTREDEPRLTIARLAHVRDRGQDKDWVKHVKMVDTASFASSFVVPRRDLPCISPAFAYLFWTGTSPALLLGLAKASSKDFRDALQNGTVKPVDDELWSHADDYIQAWHAWGDSDIFTLSSSTLSSPVLPLLLTSSQARKTPLHKLARALLEETKNGFVPERVLRAFPLHKYGLSEEDCSLAMPVLIDNHIFGSDGCFLKAALVRRHFTSTKSTLVDSDEPTDTPAHLLDLDAFLEDHQDKEYKGSKAAAKAIRSILGSACLNVFDAVPVSPSFVSAERTPTKLEMVNDLSSSEVLVVPTFTSVARAFWVPPSTSHKRTLSVTMEELLRWAIARLRQKKPLLPLTIVLTPDWTLEQAIALKNFTVVGWIPTTSMCPAIANVSVEKIRERVENGLFS